MSHPPVHFDERQIPVDQICLMLEKAESLGISSTALLRQCKLSYQLDDLRTGRVSQLRVHEFARVQQACMIEIRHRIAPAHYAGMSREDFDFMCHALITSSTLFEMLERQCRFFEIGRRRDGWSRIATDGQEASFELHLGPVEERWEFFFIVNAFHVFSRLIEWMIGEPLGARFETSCTDDAENLSIAAILGISLKSGAATNRLIFDHALLGRAIVRQPAELPSFLLNFPFDATVPTRTGASVAQRVAAMYRDALFHQRPLPTLKALSGRMGIANATLRRRLDAEGSSVRAIKNAVRARLAEELLSSHTEGAGQAAHVALTLGYSGPKAFKRASRSWRAATYSDLHDRTLASYR